MRAEVQHRMRGEVLAQIAIERAEGMGRREAFVKQQAHRVALDAHRRLYTDQHMAKLRTQHIDMPAIALMLARRRTPLRFNDCQVLLFAHMLIGADTRMHIGRRAVTLGIALQDRIAQCIHIGGQLHRIALTLHRSQRVVKALEHRQERRRAGAAGIGREVEQDHRDLALSTLALFQRDQLGHARGEHVCALAAHLHVLSIVGLLEGALPLATRT